MTSTTDYQPVISSLISEIASFTSVVATETNTWKYSMETRSLEYAIVSLTLKSAQELLATATDPAVSSSATQAIAIASSTLSVLSMEDSPYGMNPNKAVNVIMSVAFGFLFVFHLILGFFYQTWWFGISYVIGTQLEMIGFVGRSISAFDPENDTGFLIQILTLTVAPCFVMAGIYFLLAQLIMIYGPQFAVLKPMTYSYIFITCDVISLFVQGGGGGVASTAVDDYKSPDTGKNIMIGGLVFQVVSMSIFLVLFAHFCWCIRYLRADHYHLESEFNPDYQHVRAKKWFKYFPLAIFLGTAFILVRSLYRVIELCEGWRGRLITTEYYFLVLDGLMMILSIVIFIPLHPGIMIGRGSVPVIGTRAYKRMKARQVAGIQMRDYENSDPESKTSSPDSKASIPERKQL